MCFKKKKKSTKNSKNPKQNTGQTKNQVNSSGHNLRDTRRQINQNQRNIGRCDSTYHKSIGISYHHKESKNPSNQGSTMAYENRTNENAYDKQDLVKKSMNSNPRSVQPNHPRNSRQGSSIPHSVDNINSKFIDNKLDQNQTVPTRNSNHIEVKTKNEEPRDIDKEDNSRNDISFSDSRTDSSVIVIMFDDNSETQNDGMSDLVNDSDISSRGVWDDGVEGCPDNARIAVPLRNPRGYCFFNSIMQVFRGCLEFSREIIAYHYSDQIAIHDANDINTRFVNYFCKLMSEISGSDKVSTQEYYQSLAEVHTFFKESMDGDDVHKCFMTVLTTINNVIRIPVNEKTPDSYNSKKDNKAQAAFTKFRLKNQTFILKLFYGQMRFTTVCKTCRFVAYESFQVFKTIPLPVPNTSGETKLSNCIKNFLQPSLVDMEDRMECNCQGGSIEFLSRTEIIHCPKYLFIYLTRGSYYVNGVKNETFVKFSKYLNLPTRNGAVKYRLISVIDHIGDNSGGHYYCKCNYEQKQWWLISDSQVTSLGTDFSKVLSDDAMAFMFKKMI